VSSVNSVWIVAIRERAPTPIMSQHAAAAPSAKQTAGLDLLRSLKIDFDSTHETLAKLLANIVGNPAEPKYRKRTTNEKIKLLLSALGAKQLLVGSGFAEDGEFLVLPEAANISLVQLALDGLRANQSAKVAEEAAKKKEEAAAARARAMTKRRADEVPLAKVAQAKAQHILLQVSETQSFEQIDKKLAGWKAILEDAPYHNQEHDFGELAKAHSECPSGARGGNLGFFAKGKMVDEFDAICFEQKTRAIYGPVRTATGSHLIFLHARIEK
jgi:parvulin-like peptidyl-prolyl isomerase